MSKFIKYTEFRIIGGLSIIALACCFNPYMISEVPEVSFITNTGYSIIFIVLATANCLFTIAPGFISKNRTLEYSIGFIERCHWCMKVCVMCEVMWSLGSFSPLIVRYDLAQESPDAYNSILNAGAARTIISMINLIIVFAYYLFINKVKANITII